MRQNTKQKDLASLGTFLFYPSLNRNEEAVRQCRPVSNENKLKWTAGRNINSYRPARAFQPAWRIVSSRRFGRKKRPRQTEEMNWKESTCCFLFVRFHVDRELRGNEKDDGRQKNNKSTSFSATCHFMATLWQWPSSFWVANLKVWKITFLIDLIGYTQWHRLFDNRTIKF